MKKDFNGVMCWVCVKLFDAGHDKVIDHCHITEK